MHQSLVSTELSFSSEEACSHVLTPLGTVQKFHFTYPIKNTFISFSKTYVGSSISSRLVCKGGLTLFCMN